MKRLALSMFLALLAPAIQAATLYWDGTNAGWNTTGSWSVVSGARTPDPAAIPGAADDVVFNISTSPAASTISLNGDQAVNSITMISTLTGGPVIQGNTVASTDRILTIGAGGITSQSTIGFTLGSTTANQGVNVALAASQAWTCFQAIGTQNLFVRNGVRRSASALDQTLLLDATLKTTFGGTVSDGTGGGKLSLWKRGSGEAILSVANTFSGTATLQEGTLTIANANGLGSATLQLAGGTIAFSSATSYAPNAVSVIGGSTRLGSAVAATINWGTVTRPAGAGIFGRISSDIATNYVANTLTNGIVGPWALWVVSASHWDYATTVGGILTQATTTAITSINDLTAGTGGTGNVRTTANLTAGNAILSASRSGNTLYSGGQTTFTLGSYDLRLNGFGSGNFNNTINGGGTGKLLIGDSGELVVSTGNGGATLNANVGELSAGGRLTLAPYGNGNMTLAGTNTHSGGTSFHKNTLNLNGPFVLGSGPFTISGGNLDNSSAADLTLSNNNAQVWNADFTYVGTRSLNMGTGAVSLGTYPGATRTLTVTANTLTIGGSITDGSHAHLPTKALAKAGAGMLELTGASTYGGATTVSAGTMKLGASGSLSSSNITVASGATLSLAGSSSLPDGASLYLNGTNSLASGVLEQIAVLYTNGVLAANGSYGSTASGADFQNDTLFANSGRLLVGPAPRKRGAMVVIR